MSRPDFAFKTRAHTVTQTGEPGLYRAEPGAAHLRLGLDAQQVPPALLSEEMERAVAAWVMARGGREMNLNGVRRPLDPAHLDRPAARPVTRLVSIAPSNAEIVGALGAAGLLVGVEASSDFPAEILALPRLGPDLHVDMDALAALRPDLVLASLSVPGMERNIAGLERLGVPYLVLAPRTLAEIRADILRVGAAIGFEDASARVASGMEARLAELRRRGAGRAPVPVYLEWWPKPMFTPGRACWSNEMIALAGGVNVFAARPGQSLEVSPAEVAQADPRVIFVSWCGVPFEKLSAERVLRREGLETVTAVREGAVHPLDECLLGRPGPRVVEGIERMAAILGAL